MDYTILMHTIILLLDTPYNGVLLTNFTISLINYKIDILDYNDYRLLKLLKLHNCYLIITIHNEQENAASRFIDYRFSMSMNGDDRSGEKEEGERTRKRTTTETGDESDEMDCEEVPPRQRRRTETEDNGVGTDEGNMLTYTFVPFAQVAECNSVIKLNILHIMFYKLNSILNKVYRITSYDSALLTSCRLMLYLSAPISHLKLSITTIFISEDELLQTLTEEIRSGRERADNDGCKKMLQSKSCFVMRFTFVLGHKCNNCNKSFLSIALDTVHVLCAFYNLSSCYLSFDCLLPRHHQSNFSLQSNSGGDGAAGDIRDESERISSKKEQSADTEATDAAARKLRNKIKYDRKKVAKAARKSGCSVLAAVKAVNTKMHPRPQKPRKLAPDHVVSVKINGRMAMEDDRRAQMAALTLGIATMPTSSHAPIVLRDSRVSDEGEILLFCDGESSQEAVIRLLTGQEGITVARYHGLRRFLFGVPGYMSNLTGPQLVRFMEVQNPGLPRGSLRFVSTHLGPPTTFFVDLSREGVEYLQANGFRLHTLTSSVDLKPAEGKPISRK